MVCSNKPIYRVVMIDLILDDCMNVMKDYDNNHFDLAIVDPPYGIKRSGQIEIISKKNKNKKHRKYFENKNWDNNIPNKEYFDELFRVSKNQIIWGGNYMVEHLKPSMGWVFWDKGQNLTMSDGELAYTSFNRALRRIIINRVEILKDGSIHPTQKPVKLYQWLLQNYAEKGQKILDTHLGSGSIAIACYYFGVDLVGIEIDKEYYDKAKERIDLLTKQESLF